MKKLMYLVLAFSLLFFCVACGGGGSDENLSDVSKEDSAGETAEEEIIVDEPVVENKSDQMDEPADDRGIPGMEAMALLLTYESSFDIPYNMEVSATPDHSAYTCVSSAEVDGILYDYSISLDQDEEIISGIFGVTAPLASATDLYYAADLYFYAIAITNYDTGNKDELTAWFEVALDVASADGVSTTIGDATFTMYALDGQYWVEVTKVE